MAEHRHDSVDTRNLSEILRNDFNWPQSAFKKGMASLSTANFQPAWKPHISLFRRLVGETNGPIVCVNQIIKPGVLIKFQIPDDDQDSAFRLWRSFFDREAAYTSANEGAVLGRWVRFVDFVDAGFKFIVQYPNSEVKVKIPTIVFFGARWILTNTASVSRDGKIS